MDSATNVEFVRLMSEIGEEIVNINESNGWNVTTPVSWNDQYKIPSVLALIHSEVSEGLEAFRHDDIDNFTEEMADAIIRIVDMTHGLGLDIGTAVLGKLEVNRYRGYRHGGKKV